LGHNGGMAIPQAFIQDLLSRVDIVDVVGRHVTLKKGGANFMGLCPFHGEKSPSFTVSPSKQFYHCFGCGKNGNAIGFLMDHLGVGFVETVRDLAAQVGMTVPEEDISPAQKAQMAQQREQEQSLTQLLGDVANQYQQCLRGESKAVDYLKKRGLTGQVAKRFGLGYAPSGWRYLASVFPDYQHVKWVESGLVIQSDDEGDSAESKRYDRFRDRIMFPIRNIKGQVIGFGGRVLDQAEPKYLNSPETPVFHKGKELYGLFEASTAVRAKGYALVTEGYMDVVALAQHGFENAVATLGTACTPDHVRTLVRVTSQVVFAFDGDAAGLRAAHKAMMASLPHANDTRSFRFLFLPNPHDPDSYIREFGSDDFEEKVTKATPLSRYFLDSVSQGQDLNTSEGRAHALHTAREGWSLLPESAFKRQLLHDLAALTQLGTHEILDIWGIQQRQSAVPVRLSTKQSVATSKPSAAASAYSAVRAASKPLARSTRSGLRQREDHVMRWILAFPQAWQWLDDELHELLCHLPDPHGSFFKWFDRRWHEVGPQPWAVIEQAIQATEFASLAQQLMQWHFSTPVSAASTETDARDELLQHTARMLRDSLQAQQTLLIQQVAQGDEGARQTYQVLEQRIRQLK